MVNYRFWRHIPGLRRREETVEPGGMIIVDNKGAGTFTVKKGTIGGGGGPRTIVVGSGLGGALRTDEYLIGTVKGTPANGYSEIRFAKRQWVKKFDGELPKAYRHINGGEAMYAGPIYFDGMRVRSSRIRPGKGGIDVMISIHDARAVVHKSLNSRAYQLHQRNSATSAEARMGARLLDELDGDGKVADTGMDYDPAIDEALMGTGGGPLGGSRAGSTMGSGFGLDDSRTDTPLVLDEVDAGTDMLKEVHREDRDAGMPADNKS